MGTMLRTVLAFAISVALLAAGSAARADNPAEYGGLTVLGTGHHFVDDGGAALDLMAFLTRKDEKLVGFFFSQGSKNVYFYMNATVWDRLKQKLIKARDQWKTLSDREFEDMGSVKGYTVGNRSARLTLAMQGATAIGPKQVLLTAKGGADVPQRITISLSQEELTRLVDNLYKVDELFRGAPAQP